MYRSKIIIFFCLIVVSNLTIAGIIYVERPTENLDIYFFDVGQGDAIMIRTPQHQTIVIDGGPDNGVVYKLGRYLPFYERTIDLLILSHADSDHVTGLVEVLQRYQVKYVLITDAVHTSATHRQWQEGIEKKGIVTLIAGEVTAVTLAGGVILDLVYPRQSLVGQAPKLSNQASIIVKLTYQDSSFLFTGDTTKKIEKEVVRAGYDLTSTVLKVAHHGSRTSSAPEFLAAAVPQLAVVSVGRDNQFGHPNQEILDRFAEFGIPIVSTAEAGDIQLTVDRDRIRYHFFGVE